MKNLFLFVALTASTAFSAKAQTTPVDNGAVIEFSKETNDYGTIKYDSDGYCTFEFKNTGKSPLIIANAQGSCGCTIPEWPKEPIAPGKKGAIRVHYDTKRPGPFTKSVTITSNGSSTPKVIYIKGTVLPQEGATTAPATK